MYANIRSIVKQGKFDELKCIIRSFNDNLDIVVLTETWLKSEEEALRYQIPGYTHYYNYRKSSKGGGVSIFCHDKLKHNFIEAICINDNHFLWVHLASFSLDIAAIYRKPESANFNTFMDTYSMQLNQRKRTIIFGDFNLNLLSSDRQTTIYKDTMHEEGYNFINHIHDDYCTRETPTTKTIIDHVISNLKETKFHFSIIDSTLSDHKQIYLEVKKFTSSRSRKVSYQAIDYNKLYKNTSENTITNDFNSYTIFQEKILNNIKNSTVNKIKIMNPPRQDWIRKTIINEINNRNILWKHHKKNPNSKEKEQQFIKKRNEVMEKIQKNKRAYYIKSFEACLKSPRKMWDLLNSLSANKLKSTTLTNKLQTDQGLITGENKICEYFNTFFCNIGVNLANKIPNKHYYSLPRAEHSSRPIKTLCRFEPTNKAEVAKIIDSLNCNVSSGCDQISVKSIKSIKYLILNELTACINKCFEEGSFPDCLKVARVTPIYKSGSKIEPGNYRPISVLPVMSKIFEKIIYTRLESFLNNQNFFYNKQYGFRPKSNTLSATIDIVTKIKLCIDKKQVALGVFIDLKKAFDTVSHELLLKKLNEIGIQESAFKVLKSYLTNRSQIVKIRETQSNPQNITYGVPQGSILGPLLFLVYINSIHNINLYGDVSLYADDTSLFYYGSHLETIMNDAQEDLKRLNLWFQSNLLTVNASKSNYIIFAAKNKKISHKILLSINNEVITQVDQEKYLGLILDSRMTWKPHIYKIKSKLTSLMGLIRNIVRCLPRKVLYITYNSLIKPHIDYLIEIWGSAAKSNLDLLQTAQNKLLKVLFKYNFRTSTKKIYNETGLLNIYQTYVYNSCILVRKILSKDIHTNITFTKKQSIQKIRLRNANDIKLHKPRTNYGKKNIMFEGAYLYNKLPKDIKESKSTSKFKRLLKNYVKNIIPTYIT